MNKFIKRWRRLLFRREEGQSLVEFAFVFPVLLIFFSGIADTGWMIYNYISLADMTDTAVHANIKSNPSDAEDFISLYIEKSFPEFKSSGIQLSVDTRVTRYDYYDYVYKQNKNKHWKVPMYYKILKTTLDINYQVDYLTPMGKLIFGDTDNHMDLSAHSSAIKVLENDGYKQ